LCFPLKETMKRTRCSVRTDGAPGVFGALGAVAGFSAGFDTSALGVVGAGVAVACGEGAGAAFGASAFGASAFGAASKAVAKKKR
jgi:hypothetical protein